MIFYESSMDRFNFCFCYRSFSLTNAESQKICSGLKCGRIGSVSVSSRNTVDFHGKLKVVGSRLPDPKRDILAGLL